MASDGKRLAPFLPELLSRLAARQALPDESSPSVIERVGQMSPASVDRLLRPHRGAWPRRGIGTTKPGTLLKQQVPIRTFAEWDDARPGFFELDLVAHCGVSGAGEFVFTLSAVGRGDRLDGVAGRAQQGRAGGLRSDRTTPHYPAIPAAWIALRQRR
jgi:hypothetical protein